MIIIFCCKNISLRCALMSTTQVCDCSVVGLVQVVDYYKEACRALENSDTASMLGKIQKDWKKLVQMKIYYFASIAHVSLRQDSVL